MLESEYFNYVQTINDELSQSGFKMDDKTLVYFANTLDDCDIFLLLLTASVNTFKKPLFVMDLTKHSSLITYSTRNCMKSFTRLVAMGFMKEQRGIKNAVAYTLTNNGNSLLGIIRDFLPVNAEVLDLGRKIGHLLNKEDNQNEQQ